jgi:hypothetical protein
VLKPVSITTTAAVAWPLDPAFDATQAEREACAAKMVDDVGAWKQLKVKAGEQPTVFTIGVIPASTLTLYEDQCGPRTSRMLYWLCFKRGIQGLAGYPPAWLYNEKEIPMVDPGNGMPKHVSAAWLEQHFNGQLRECGVFIGTVIYRWQDLAGGDVKN